MAPETELIAAIDPELLLAGLLLVVLVALVVTRPLLAREDPVVGEAGERAAAERRAALEAAKEAKYREIRDAELDFRMGKLSDPDYRATDRELRAQAISILREIDALEGRSPGAERESD